MFLLSSMVAVASVSFDVGPEKTKHQTEVKCKVDLSTPLTVSELSPEVRWCSVDFSNFIYTENFTFIAPKRPDIIEPTFRYGNRSDKLTKVDNRPKFKPKGKRTYNI